MVVEINCMMKHKIVIALAMFATSLCANAQVTVHINSGNPAYPFPQFLEYAYGDDHRLGNLGTKNAEGVVHAELEQDIRDAYQIHANEFSYTGESWAGIRYIETPYKSAYDCTEGDGYGLLACAYMADQVTFNGYWMCTHDKRMAHVKRYIDCGNNGMNYQYGTYALGDTGSGSNTAADGDVDVALALYVAYKQWGEFMRNEAGEIVRDACGNPISYKEAMIQVLRGLVEMTTCRASGDIGNGGKRLRVNSGLIGLDGYPKGGDTWVEQTAWATNNPLVFNQPTNIYNCESNSDLDVNGLTLVPEFGGSTKQHIDYNAPAYFREFYELFQELGGDPWEIEQFRRGEASSDWLIGELIKKNKYSLPTAGWVDVSANNGTTFTNFNQGEDYRCSWRTICNYMWHGNPKYTWNPTTHKVEDGGNTYEYDAAVKMSKFLNDPAHWNTAGGSECIEYGDPKIPYSGPATLNIQYDPMTGITQSSFYVLNWQNGTGTYSAVSAQDYDLMGLLYRQCAIEWDNNGTVATRDEFGNSCYLNTKSNYMHGWARHMGMMVVSGNYPAPSQMKPMPNMKIYRAIEDSVTYCYTGDQIKFLLDYRNYGSVDAENVRIVENVPDDFVFVEASNGGVYDAATHTVTWNIGTVSGFKSDNNSGVTLDFTKGNLAKTVGQVWYTLKAGNKASGRYCTSAEITCSNGYGWVTNEYPNYKTPTMQRNCVDVVKRSLIIEKEANTKRVNSGNVVSYEIKFENSSDVGYIDGGRPRVNVSFANGLDGARLQLMVRLWNDAIEPYINYGNYRISYFLYDASLDKMQTGNEVGWALANEIYEGGKTIGSAEGVVVSQENIVEGEDSFGKWNQRVIVQFAPLLVTTTMHVSRYFGGAGCRIHKGGGSPMRGVWALYPSNYGSVTYSDDWSWGNYGDDKGGLFYPVTPSWQKLDENGKSIEEPIDKWLTCGCTSSSKTIPNILVEEFDGYVWRRILGNGPMPGRDVENVVIRDTLPKGLKFETFVGDCPLEDKGATLKTAKTSDGRDIIIWSIPKLQVKQKGIIAYTATASFPSGKSCTTDDEDIDNIAWIMGDQNSPIGDTATVTVTCGKVPIIIEPTTMVKTADKELYAVGDEITYTIEYEQTHGTVYENAGSNSSDWDVSGASISNGTVAINQGQSATYKNSKAQNLHVEMQWSLSDDQETEIFVRDNIRIVFKNEYQGLSATCYDGSSSKGKQTIAKVTSPVSLAIDITDDVLQVWVKKATTASPSFTFSGLTVKEGMFGFRGTAWGNFSYSKITVKTDKGYDLKITDPLPDGVAFVSATKGGSVKNGAVTWDFSADNPIGFKKKYTVQWTGKVTACDAFLENIAYANMRTHAENSIAAQAIVECGNNTPDPPIVEDLSYCQGDDADELTAIGENLQWYASNKTTKLPGAPTPSTADAVTTTYYVTQTVDGVESSKAPLAVVVHPKPSKPTIAANSPVCAGEELTISTLSMQNATYKWTGPNGFSSTNVGNTISSASVSDAGEYSVVVTSEFNCVSDEATKEVVVNPVPDKPEAKTSILYCKGQTAEVLTADGDNLQWYSSATATTALSEAPTPTTNVVKDVNYYVSQTVEGCESERLEILVSTVDKPDAPQITTNSPVCAGESLELGTSVDGTYEWTGPNNFTSDKQNLSIDDVTVDAAGTYSLVVTVGTCRSDEATKVIEVNPIPATPSPTNNGPKCEGEIATVSTANVSRATYTWTSPSGTIYNDQSVTVTEAGEYSVVVTVAGCESAAGTTELVIYAKPEPPVVEDVQYCQGETAKRLTAEGTFLGWYENATGGFGVSSAPIPSTATTGTNTYYVTQKVNNCESDRAEIKVQTLEPPTKPVITVNSPVCAGDAISFETESQGTYTWSGPNAFNSTEQNPEIANAVAGSAGEYSLVVKVGNCTSEAGTATVVVNPIPSITFDPVANQCVDGADVTLHATAMPSGGIGEFSGTGVSGTSFSPSQAGVGTHTITYTYTVNNCTATETIDIVVQDKPEVSFTLPTTACASSDVIALVGNQTGGTFTAVPNIDLSAGFIPANATVKQEYTITYEYSDGVCSNSTSNKITVYDPQKPVGVDAAEVYTKVSSGTVPELSATGVNMIWYSDEALTTQVQTGDSYTPSETVVLDGDQGRIGTYTYYVVSTEEGCTSEATAVHLEILSCMVKTPKINSASVSVCEGETDPDKRIINVVTDAYGMVVRWYNTARELKQESSVVWTFDPELSEVGSNVFFVTAFDEDQNCESPFVSVIYAIRKLPTVSFNLPEEVCEGSDVIDFAPLKSQESGVVMSLWGDQGPETSFSPDRKGTYNFEYSYTDARGCTNSIEKQIVVHPLPDVRVNPIPDACEYDDPIDLSFYAEPIAGTFAGSGVTQNILFNPAAVTAGTTATLTYTYVDGKNCSKIQDFSINVVARPQVTFSDVPSLCVGGEKHDLLQYVTPTTGTFSGEFVDGTDFNPTTNGSHKVSYTVESNGCSTTVEKTIVVNELPVLTLETNDVACVNTGNVTPQLFPAGGTFKIDDEVATAINTETLAIGNHTLLYEYKDPSTKCENSLSKPLEIRKIESPVVADKTVVIGSADLTITATGNGGTLEWTDKQNGSKTTAPSISNPTSDYAGEWEYCVTESDGTCTSEPACMKYTVIWCPAQAPHVTVSGAYVNERWADVLYTEICASDEVPIFHVTGIEDGATINWYDGRTGNYVSVDSPEAYQNNAIKGKPGEYSMSVSQTTTGENGCTSIPTSVIVNIHENPQISINNDQLHFCDYDDRVKIEVSSGVYEGEFTFSGEAVVDGYFYPSLAETIGSAIPITVEFTDNSEIGCSTSESSRFYVHHVEPLTVQSPITQLESDYETVLSVTPDGNNKAVWYDDCGDGKSQLFVGSTYQTGLVGMNSEIYGVTQRDRYGCESECAIIQVDRIKCPTPAPTVYVDQDQICATDEIPTFTASGLDDVEFTWYENGEIVGFDKTFTPSSLKGKAGEYTWMVTQTTTGANGCEGVGAPATLKIHQSPEIVVTISDVICMNEGVVVPQSNLTGTQFAFDGAKVSVIDPTLYTPGTYKLAYAYYDPVTGCPAVESQYDCYTDDCMYKMIEIREIPKVVVNNTTSLIIAESFPISIASGHGGDYTWTDADGNVVGEGATMQHPYEVAVGSWKYCVTESDEVCTSDPACMTFTIIDCPVPAPKIVETNIIGCTNEPMKAMEAEDQGYMVRWYKEDDANTVQMTGLSYTPDDLTSAGVYKYYVTQADETCEGLPTMVTYELKTTELPIVDGLATLCENDELDLVADDVVSWYSEDPKTSSPVEESDVFTISYPEAGEYTVYAIRTDEYCSSDPLALTVTVNKIPAQPVVTTNNVCEGSKVVFNAVGTDIIWYQSGYEVEAGETYEVENVHAGEIAVQATQTIDGCTSPLTDDNEVVAVVYPIPERPTAVNRTICEDADIQSIQVQAYAETVTWYSDEELTTVVETGTTYMPKTKETQTYYVVQTENSCSSEPVAVTFTVQQNPEPVRFKQTTDIVSCEGSQVVIMTETSNTVYWYDSQDGFPIYTGRFFTIDNTEQGSYVYYAQQKDKYGCKSGLSAKKVMVKSAPTVAKIVQEDTICIYENQGMLIAERNNDDEAISWISPKGETLDIGDTLVVDDTMIDDAGVYLFRARTTNTTCSYETRKEIPLKFVVLPQPEAPKLTTESFCYTGEPVKLVAEGENILWYTPEGNMIAGCPYKKECNTYYIEAGTYDVYMTQNVNGCVSDTVANQFLISALPSPYIVGKSQLCANSNEVYVVTKTNESNFIDWTLTGNRVSYDMSNYSTGFVRSIDWIDPGVDTIFVIEKNKYGCMGKTEMVVEVIPVPDAQFITELLGQEGVVTFTNTSEPQILDEGDFSKEYHVDYYWDFGRFADSSNILENKKVFDREYPYGDHTVELTAINEFGCTAKYTEGFFVNVEHRLFIPSAFAPMSPGNEVRIFKPKGVNCKTFEIWIYDAWNNLVYYSSGVDERGAPIASWDGMVNGKMKEAGTYRYKILVTFEDHEEETMRVTQNAKPIFGNVMLMR